MEIRQLEAFVRVADTKNFTRAAAELSLTQPAVTRQILALERQLQTRLFDRLGRRVEMTAAGTMLYRYATEILHLVDESQQAVFDIGRGVSGTLALGSSSTAATYLLPPLLGAYREAHPGVELSVYTGDSSRIAEMVLSNAVDIGIALDYQEQKGLRHIVLGHYSNEVVVYPEHELALEYHASNGVQPYVPMEALARSPLLLMQPGTSLRRTYDNLLSGSDLSPQVFMELDSVEAIKKMIEAKLGISILPRLAVRLEVVAGRLVSLPLQKEWDVQRNIVALHRKDKYLTAAMKSFIGLAVGELKEGSEVVGVTSD